MRNGIFEIRFNAENGGISRLVLVSDPHKMNFCRDGRELAVLRGFSPAVFEQTESFVRTVGVLGGVEAVTEYSFDGEDLVVHTLLTNKNSYPMYFSNGDLCIEMPFNDAYEASDICMRERCHAHIWAGQENSYIRTERMGESDCHVGLVFEKGSIHSYRQEDCNHSVRGHFALNVSAFSLQGGESYEIRYRIFAHTGGEDFFARAKNIKGFLQVHSPRGYSFFEGETISFEVLSGEKVTEACLTLRGETLPCKTEGNYAKVSFVPKEIGEHEVLFCINGRKGKAVFNVLPAFEKLLKTRIDFIIDKQQCMDASSPLYGAYLVYDNEEDRQYFDYALLDHNANRERLGMALTILRWLGTHEDARVRKSLDLFTEFLLRECVDEEKGTCYGNIGKDERFLRLYNAPWVALYFAELYNVTRDLRWARLLARILHYYYSVGGAKFYPNGIRFATFYRVLKGAGLDRECEESCAQFDEHVKMILRNGTNYPPHEVNYEQTIVTPAVTILLDKYTLSGEPFYLDEAKKHLRILRKFDGCQPHFRLHNIPIRYWDDFWFGKKGIYGDVFPHYWSVLSGYGYHLYGMLSDDEAYEEIARQCMMNCLCNIYPNGRATCAYVYPEWVSGRAWSPQKHMDITEACGARKGTFADAFANDQDFALYFFMKMHGDLKNRKEEKMKNPIAEGWYADPESRVYGDSVYIYVTHSLPFEEQTNLSLFYTKDLKDFSHEKDILDMETYAGATSAIWAPSVVEKNGRYYIVFAANNIYHDGEPGGLYIGESDTPLGPFRNIYADGRPFINIFIGGAQPIDAHFYKEENDIYLYYGGWGHLIVCKMSEDMRSYSDAKEITPKDYVEAPYVMKEDEKYLLMYSSGNWMDGTYRVLCASADQPYGPFTDSYEVLGNSEIACGAGHNSAFFFGGKYYIAYHRRLYEDKNPHHRILCIDEMQLEGGKILPIEMT